MSVSLGRARTTHLGTVYVGHSEANFIITLGLV